MTTQTIQPEKHQTFERLRALGMSLVHLSADGTSVIIGDSQKFDPMLVKSRMFKTAVALNWSGFAECKADGVELWPGLHLIPVDAILDSSQDGPGHTVAMILSEPFAKSEQLVRLCTAEKLDYISISKQLSEGRLVSEQERQRLVMSIGWMIADSTDKRDHTGEVETLSEELSNTYEELSLLYTLSSSMNVNQPPVDFLRHACSELQQVAGMGWVSLRLTTEEPRLEGMAGQVIIQGPHSPSKQSVTAIGDAVLARYDSTSEPVIIEDTAGFVSSSVEHADNLLGVPLRLNDQRLGFLLCGDRLDGEHFNSVDAKLCESLCNSLVIFLENMMLYEDAQAMFLGTLHALTSAIDAKDSYTRGHSERVAMLSRMLAEQAGLDEHTVERVYLSGLIHDVGKIGVPEAVLSKPGKLTLEEFELIKMHPEIGANILNDIRQMSDLIPGVLYHHEKWNGRGYPTGLAGQDIPLFGRLIGLADAFDAMSSNRTYRSAIPHKQVLDEIRDCAGTQFDPELAEVFVKMDFAPFEEMLEKHQQQSQRKSA